jgi:hypothetical protein
VAVYRHNPTQTPEVVMVSATTRPVVAAAPHPVTLNGGAARSFAARRDGAGAPGTPRMPGEHPDRPTTSIPSPPSGRPPLRGSPCPPTATSTGPGPGPPGLPQGRGAAPAPTQVPGRPATTGVSSVTAGLLLCDVVDGASGQAIDHRERHRRARSTRRGQPGTGGARRRKLWSWQRRHRTTAHSGSPADRSDCPGGTWLGEQGSPG